MEENGSARRARSALSSEPFILVSRIAAIVAAIVGPILLVDVRFYGDQLEKIVAEQNQQTTQLALMAQTQTMQANELSGLSQRMDQINKDLVEARNRILCLEVGRRACEPNIQR